MKKKAIIVGMASVAVLIIVIIGALYVYLAPSNKQRKMSEQYSEIAKDERMIVMNNTILKERAVNIEGKIYLPMQVVTEYFNQRFFWDGKENVFTYALPTGLITTGLNKKVYQMGTEEKTVDYNILTKKDKQVYIAIDFVKEYSSIVTNTYENPSRIVAINDAKTEFSFVVLGSGTRLRVGPNKKYEYLISLEKGQELFVDHTAEDENEYKKVMTLDGIIGYVSISAIDEEIKKTFEIKDKEPIFEQTKVNQPICLAWHQTTSMVQNTYFSQTIKNAKGLNVISPTWFSLTDNKGNFSSLVSEAYVQEAHNKGLKVWVLIDDFNKKVNLEKLLGRTSTRQQLIKNLVANAIQYNVDGINIDFEKISKKSASAYLEFLRELSIKCRSNQLVLSVDNYMPASYNSHYNLTEQGKVVDYLIFMGYDEHYAGSEKAGSVSSIGFIEEGLEKIMSMVPKERVIMALPFYTRLWSETKKGDSVKIGSQAYGMDSAQSVVSQNGALATWDETTKQYYAEYKKGKVKYKIWLEEEKSLEQKLLAVKKQEVVGVAFWKLGFERASIWDVILKSGLAYP